MNVRLIKSGMSPPEQKDELPERQVPIIDTIQSWVREFQVTRANRIHLDFKRISNTGKV